MAISVNWITGEITIPRADMPIIQATPEIRELDTDQFLFNLKDAETSQDGRPWPDTQTHKTEYTISGITYAQAIEIIPPYFVTFEDGQYGVNLTQSNNNILEISTENQVRVRGNNSAGLINPLGIDRLDQKIWVDTAAAFDGVGTQQSPFNSAASAFDFADQENLKLFRVLDDIVLDRAINGYEFEGVGDPMFDFNGFATPRCTFRDFKLTGTISNGAPKTFFCVMDGVVNLDGRHEWTGLDNTNTLAASANCILVQPYSAIAGLSRPTLDMNAASTGTRLSVRGHSGGLTLTNCNHVSDEATIEIAQGRLELAASCSSGTISVRGIVPPIDNSTGSATDFEPTLDPNDVRNTLALTSGLYATKR